MSARRWPPAANARRSITLWATLCWRPLPSHWSSRSSPIQTGVVVDHLRTGRSDAGIDISNQARERVIRLVADYVGEPITRDDPRLSGVLPTGERFQGFLPPVSAQAAYSIRKRPAVIWTLADYVEAGVLSARRMAEVLRAAVRARRNVLVSGGTGSGKTTLGERDPG